MESSERNWPNLGFTPAAPPLLKSSIVCFIQHSHCATCTLINLLTIYLRQQIKSLTHTISKLNRAYMMEFVYVGWLVVLGFYATLTGKVISWQSVTHIFPDFLTSLLTRDGNEY